MKRIRLFTVGQRPSTINGYKIALPSGRALVRVEWREHGRRLTRSWEDSAEGRRLAKATAKGIKQRLDSRGIAVVARLRVGELFDKYVLALSPGWRPGTLKNARNNWRLFQETVSPTTYADLVTQETLDEVRAALRGRGIAPNQIRACLTRVLAVWTWARRRRILAENVLADYENALPKDGQPLDVPEYTPADVAALMAQLSFRSSRTWRTWCAVQIASLLGPRQNALLNLEWRDVDLRSRTVRWRAELDKRGREREQPLPREAVFAFRVAAMWRRRSGYMGRFVFLPVQARRADRPWTYAALSAQLTAAEGRAGIAHVAYRGMHGFRRGACKNVLAVTNGDLNKAGEWIGDTDLRTLKRSYLKTRPEELRSVANLLRMPTENGENPKAVATERQSNLSRRGVFESNHR
jgi:integrase